MTQLEAELMRTIQEQRSKREAVQQIRSFMSRFDLGAELDIVDQLRAAEAELARAEQRRTELDRVRFSQIHPTDDLRRVLRSLSTEVENIHQAIADTEESIAEQKALRAELITAKTKAYRLEQAGRMLELVRYQRCPECGTDIPESTHDDRRCHLCGSTRADNHDAKSQELEALRRDLNERMDQIGDSITRRGRDSKRRLRQLAQISQEKASLDRQLQEELARYDSAFVESIRTVERQTATLIERIRSLQQLRQMPQAINELEQDAGALQGRIDLLRTSVAQERDRLSAAEANIEAIAAEFKRIMISVSFPGVSEEDRVVIDPRNWKPVVLHDDLEWTFWDTGAGGKKTLFNVCYALAIHAAALERGMPVPQILIVDSPTKNISKDMNPEQVRLLYEQIYHLARGQNGRRLQFLLIDSDLVEPRPSLPGFRERRMAGEPDAPSLIPYYTGP
jgi:rubrerythrin